MGWILIYDDTIRRFISIDENILVKGIYYETINPERILRIWKFFKEVLFPNRVSDKSNDTYFYTLNIQINYIPIAEP